MGHNPLVAAYSPAIAREPPTYAPPAYQAISPPSITSSIPVTHDDSAQAR